MHERHRLTTWLEPKPLAVIERLVAAGETWEAADGGRVVASFTLAAKPPAFYDLAWFGDSGEPARYVSSLAVEPAAQGAGVGRACIEWSLAATEAAGARSLRLDTAGDNEPAQRFFAAVGFARRSPVVELGRFSVIYFERRL